MDHRDEDFRALHPLLRQHSDSQTPWPKTYTKNICIHLKEFIFHTSTVSALYVNDFNIYFINK